ncbi:MAG: hypothetical protein AB8I08_25150 [Sandaracinaceae bacterium]
MSRFWGGFFVASVLWAAAGAYLFFVAGFAPPEEEPLEVADAPIADAGPPEEEATPRRRRRRRRRPRRGARADDPSTPAGNATVGDDLREDEMRTLDMGGSGGEARLSNAQVEAGFDSVMGRIRRCLVLMEGNDPVRGRLTFGMRITSSGRVEAVRLSGPRAATTGEAGSCMQSTARGIRFDSFDGPTMVVRYPLTLE